MELYLNDLAGTNMSFWFVSYIRQATSVQDYIDCFAGLMDQLTPYEDYVDPLHYTMKFVDGFGGISLCRVTILSF